MGDNPKKKGADAKRVSKQYGEVKYMLDTHKDLSPQLLSAVVREVGTSRAKVESKLAEKGIKKTKRG